LLTFADARLENILYHVSWLVSKFLARGAEQVEFFANRHATRWVARNLRVSARWSPAVPRREILS
jgi:hypothetical protein